MTSLDLCTLPPIPSEYTRALFPLGGIGTGTVYLDARGGLRDWKIQNRMRDIGHNPNTFFAISAEPDGGARVARVLQAERSGPRDGSDTVLRDLEGLPRLRSATMRGEYPFARIDFDDDKLPVRVSLLAFTPLIPLEADDSGIPAAVIRYSVENPGPASASVSIAGSLTHRGGLTRSGRYRARQSAEWRDDGGMRGLFFDVDLDPADLDYGTMALLTSAADVTSTPEWVEPRPDLFWPRFAATGRLAPSTEQDKRPEPSWFAYTPPGDWRDFFYPKYPTGSIAITQQIPPGESREFEFVIAWHFPNRALGWNDGGAEPGDGADVRTTRNYYATLWRDAWDVGGYLQRNLGRLESATTAFHDSLFGSTLDPAVLHALSGTMTSLRSLTTFRIEDGSFFGWEGSDNDLGNGSGTCTHVWTYAQTAAWLFPDLERRARRIEFLHETEPDGRQRFRGLTYLGEEPFTWPGAADGQLGTIIRLHREWRFSGDDEFLRELWPAARASVDWCLRTWDADRDGLIESETHNTYDIEFVGPEPLSGIFLLAALRAAARMAEHLGEDDVATRYTHLAERSARALDDRLFTGEYYRQDIADVDRRPNQYGAGVLSDQLLGQWHAHLNGLGDLLPREHLRSAIQAVFRSNFRPALREHANSTFAFAFGEDAGLVVASWPHGGRPKFPMFFADMVWSGVEYAVAGELVYLGLPEEALTLVRAIRRRHTGETRSPWDDVEAGHHYARAMSAWGLLLAFSGAHYDAPSRTLSFDPVSDGTYFFTTGSGWGQATIAGSSVQLDVRGGTLDIENLVLRGRRVDGPVTHGHPLRPEP
jgi:uncharacterized protein (DUF608 family)